MANIQLYAVSTASLMVGLGAQSLAFVIIARHLGKAQFGQLAAVTAAASLGTAWAQLGSAEAMRRRVGRDPSIYRNVLGHCITLIFGWGSVLTLAFAVGVSLFIHLAEQPIPNFGIVGLLVVCNIVLFPWIVLAEQIFLAHNDFVRANVTNAGFGALRALTAVVACSGFGVNTLSAWAFWNFGAYLLGSVACAVVVSPYGSPRLGLLREEIPIGATFGVSGFLGYVRANVDVLSLSAVAPPAVVGTYGLARRIIGLAIVPNSSLDRIIYSRLVVAGKGGPAATIKLAYRYAFYGLGLAGSTALALYLIAGPILPLIFGKSFVESIGILKVLCWIIPCLAAQFIAFDALNAANLHKFQTFVSTITVLFGVAMVIALTYKFSVNGTLIAVYIAEGSLAITLWAALVIISGRKKGASKAK
jgi:O-antigen/teichoic acid export membrane protein